jgi:hypothetical protein
MSLIIDTVFSHLPFKRKTTPSGWTSFNAVCCHHNGTTPDTRQRGGIILNGDSISYHCFNCEFKTSWQIGRQLTVKFRKLMRWLGVPDDLITKCSIESLKLKDEITKSSNIAPTVFLDKALPKGAEPIYNFLDDVPEKLIPVLEYINKRSLYLDDYPFYWTPEDGFDNRLIIPYFYQGRIVGYTCRKITDGKPKYIAEQQPGYVFNIDQQDQDKKIVIVCEGQIDAICIEAVAVMSSEVGEQQRRIIDALQRRVIVVPDRDKSGYKIIEQAIEFGWNVSFPNWEDCKDINDSCIKYGRLHTLHNIVLNAEQNELKIKLFAKQWLKGYTDV